MSIQKLMNIIFFVLFIFALNGFAHPGKVIKTLTSPAKFPSGLTFDGKNLWLADYREDRIYVVDPADGQVLRHIPSPGFWPMGLAWDGKYLWNVDQKQKKIFRLDPADGTILFVIDAPSANPEGLTWDGKTLWVSDARDKTIMKLDLSDGTALKSFAAPAQSAQGLTFDGRYLWCSDRFTDEIYMIDPESGEVIIIIKAPGSYPRGLAWDGKYLWNVDYQSDQIYQMIRQDDEHFILTDPRKAKISLIHDAKVYGTGMLKNMDVYLAIPENLPQQNIAFLRFNPIKYELLKDRWGQAVAHFNYQDTQSSSALTTIMEVEAEIAAIQYFIFPDRCGSLKDIPKEIVKTYTADGSKYVMSDPYIQNLAKQIVGTETNPYWIARKIFDYVRNTLEYHLEGGWNVAPFVLKRGTGSCSEYTFSFIALARSAGLPARYVGAIVVRGDDASMDDVFHRWPEVYLPNYGWIPIDPQGGDKPLARDRARNIGQLSNRFLITTQGGGDSEYLGWYYNYNQNYQTDPQVLINLETFAEWEPLEVSIQE